MNGCGLRQITGEPQHPRQRPGQVGAEPIDAREGRQGSVISSYVFVLQEKTRRPAALTFPRSTRCLEAAGWGDTAMAVERVSALVLEGSDLAAWPRFYGELVGLDLHVGSHNG